MDAITLDGPDGVDVRMGTDAALGEHERRHLLARDLIAARLNVRHDDIRLRREPPGAFGHHTHLLAAVDDAELPLVIKAASRGDATVVGIADVSVPLGFDVRPSSPDEGDLSEMRRHSHLFPDTGAAALLQHWTRVQAVREADGRGARLQPEHIRLDPVSGTAWVPDRRIHYRLADMSRDGWTITLAYGAGPR